MHLHTNLHIGVDTDVLDARSIMDGGLLSVFGTGDTTDATHVDSVVTTGGTGASFYLAMACGTAFRRLIRKPLDILIVHLLYRVIDPLILWLIVVI